MEPTPRKTTKTRPVMAASTFVAARHPTESCGKNGLPLTPNSIAVLGQAQTLKTLSTRHVHLGRVLDCIRDKQERILLVQEYAEKTLESYDIDEEDDKWAFLERVATQIASALDFLHENGVVHATLRPSKVLVFDKGILVKLYDFGLAHLTASGVNVDFPIFDPRFTAPEVLAAGIPDENPQSPRRKSAEENDDEDEEDVDSLTRIPEAPKPRYDPSCDIWSLGVILASTSLGLKTPWRNLKIGQVLRKVLSFAEFQGNVLERIARENDRQERIKDIPDSLRDLINACLNPQPNLRPTAQNILIRLNGAKVEAKSPLAFPTMSLRCRLEQLNGFEEDEDEDAFNVLTLEEIYYLWRLAGGDVISELRKRGLVVTKPPILSLSKVVGVEGHSEGRKKERSTLFDPVVIPLSLQQLESCLKEFDVEDIYPLLESRDSTKQCEVSVLPLIIKEYEVRYQF